MFVRTASRSDGSGCLARSRAGSDACLPDQWDRGAVASAAANSAFESGTARLFLRVIQSGKPQAAAAEQGRNPAPREWRRIRVRNPVPARLKDTTLPVRIS